jgi:hypothetical protein
MPPQPTPSNMQRVHKMHSVRTMLDRQYRGKMAAGDVAVARFDNPQKEELWRRKPPRWD